LEYVGIHEAVAASTSFFFGNAGSMRYPALASVGLKCMAVLAPVCPTSLGEARENQHDMNDWQYLGIVTHVEFIMFMYGLSCQWLAMNIWLSLIIYIYDYRYIWVYIFRMHPSHWSSIETTMLIRDPP
jgi:hypothetical protein